MSTRGKRTFFHRIPRTFTISQKHEEDYSSGMVQPLTKEKQHRTRNHPRSSRKYRHTIAEESSIQGALPLQNERIEQEADAEPELDH
jgi:hypothetical protein